MHPYGLQYHELAHRSTSPSSMNPNLTFPPLGVNPKAARADQEGKAPLQHLERVALEATARVLAGGADKYGERNYRSTNVLVSTYVGAVLRHALAWADGEDLDPDDGEHHLAHVEANVHVVLGALAAGTLVDDRHSA